MCYGLSICHARVTVGTCASRAWSLPAQRPGTAKGFVFLTLEDETGTASVIVSPSLFAKQCLDIVDKSFLMAEGTLQIQEGVTSVKAEKLSGLSGQYPAVNSHDFY